MAEHSMIITGFCALLVAGALFRLARPPVQADSGMMEGYFYIQSASYAGVGTRTGSSRDGSEGAGTGGVGSEGAGTWSGVRSGTGASTSLFGSPISAMSFDSEKVDGRGPGAATLWTNEAMGHVITERLLGSD